jgi:hypothetical protein
LHGGGCFDDSGVAALGCDEFGALKYLLDLDKWERNCRAYFHRAVYRAVVRSGWKTFAIILNLYQMEQVQFSEEDGGVATPVGRLPDGCSLGPVLEKAVDIFNVQQYLYHSSGRANHVDGCVAAPPRLQLFTFLLHRFFDLQFQQSHLWRADKNQDYLQFLSDGAISTSNLMSDGTGILANFNAPPVYSFRALDWNEFLRTRVDLVFRTVFGVHFTCAWWLITCRI